MSWQIIPTWRTSRSQRIKRLNRSEHATGAVAYTRRDSQMPIEWPAIPARCRLRLPKHVLTAFEPRTALFLGLLTCRKITRPHVLLSEQDRDLRGKIASKRRLAPRAVGNALNP
jgi:hypothetical protein